MKNVTRNAYAHCVDRVVARLQRAIAEGGELPDLGELAGVAHLSPFHFHRVYRAMTGETIGRTVARLRLLRALHLLGESAVSVTAVALAVGYDTPQALARAFSDAFDASPSELRAQPQRLLRERERLERLPQEDRGVAAPLYVEVVAIEPFEVVVLRNRGAYEDFDQAYGRLFAWAAEAGFIDRIQGLYGLPLHDHRDTSPAHLEFDCALAFPESVQPEPPLRALLLGGGAYACARHLGSFATLEASVDWLLAVWLPGSGHSLRDAPIHYRYLDDPEVTPEALLRTDIHVPLAAHREASA